MTYCDCTLKEIYKKFQTNAENGLDDKKVLQSRRRFGGNVISRKKPKKFVNRLIEALLEPMMLILLVAFVITLGINIGRSLRGEASDYYECIGIFIAIAVSCLLTVIMEGKSQRAFEMLDKLSGSEAVKVLRDGKVQIIGTKDLVVGDVVYLEAGNKIPADGRIISCDDFFVDESMLTGESLPIKKNGETILSANTPLAERYNCVFGGTFCERGSCVYVVAAVGDNGEIGRIAEGISQEKKVSAPLNDKLSRLGKMVTIFGVISSLFVFILSVVRLYLSNQMTFNNLQDVFIRSIVLIVAAVPEGLPTTVAISLTLNVLRLAKSNALIRKLVATETVGCVSVICSDKTGTLTKNKMSVVKIVGKNAVVSNEKIKDEAIVLNAALNSTAEITTINGEVSIVGSKTEGALLETLLKSGYDYSKLRKNGAISPLTPFSSQLKYMETINKLPNGEKIIYIKGAPEKVLDKCLLSEREKSALLSEIAIEQKNGARVIAFASTKNGAYNYDGYAVIADGLRDDVKKSITSCKNAGISVKMLTGDNKDTAKKIAYDAGLSVSDGQVVTADYIESLTDDELNKVIKNVTVIARSTPQTKLRVVKALQSLGEVVAVTGDGVNDAPAIKHADIGIAMGDGSEITKQASDVVLLDNCFSTILQAITFGRNVYSNFQRFICFQLTVNLASMSIIIASLVTGFESPFSSTCLLWLNIIMDGPLALSLGLELRQVKYLSRKPVKRSDDILSGKILLKIAFTSAIMCATVILQRFTNFLGAKDEENSTVVITLFVFFQVFNALNCREVTSESCFKGILDNKLLLAMIVLTYFLHVFIITFVPKFFGTTPLSVYMLAKITAVCFSIVLLSEISKLFYKFTLKGIKNFRKKQIKPEFSINEKISVT